LVSKRNAAGTTRRIKNLMLGLCKCVPPKPVVGGWLRQWLGSVTARRESACTSPAALTIIVIQAQNCLHSLLVDLVEDEKVYFHSLTVNRLEDLNERPSVLRSTTCPTHQPTTRQL